ncbi:MAG: alpha-ketoglutarate-dependent dioxygenase AlkB [Gemmatimonadetes bacterium]|nr:alpha-ketoglutarate-dependent dioxygenase AlkB [Gemmatimonadota bacterium]
MQEQLSLFSRLPPLSNQEAIDVIAELDYKEDYINESKHNMLMKRIDEQQWLNDLKRRVQHYGYKYDYKARRVARDMRIGNGKLPEWLEELSEKLWKDRHMPKIADQVIVNEYRPGQGISRHIDCEPCFEDTIVSLSLGSGCFMDFTNKDEPKKISDWLEPRSIVVLKNAARYKWLHGIAARKSDKLDGYKHDRRRRVSLTFRKVIID